MSEPNNHLSKQIGVWGMSANMINIMVGAGIYVLPATVGAKLGPAGILAYIFCSILIATSMLCFAEVGSKISAPGGAYAYIETSFGKYAGFLTSVLFVLACVTSDAAIANALTDIITSLIPFLKGQMFRIIFMTFLFAGLAYLNIWSVKKSVRIVEIITLFKLIPLLLILFIGIHGFTFKNFHQDSFPGIKTFGETALLLFFAFAIWQAPYLAWITL